MKRRSVPISYHFPLPSHCQARVLPSGEAEASGGSGGVWHSPLPQCLLLPFLVLLSTCWKPGFQPPGRRFRGSFSGTLTCPREMTFIFCYLWFPNIRARSLSHHFSVRPTKKLALHPHGAPVSCEMHPLK